MPDQVKPCQKVRLLPEIWEEIDKRAAIEERSRNKMIELLIRRGLKVTYIECELNPVIKEGKEITNTKNVISARPNAQPAPQSNKAKFGGVSYDPNKIKI